jgi:hypothetical protein
MAIVFSVSKCQYLQGNLAACCLTEFMNQLKIRPGFSPNTHSKELRLDRCL